MFLLVLLFLKMIQVLEYNNILTHFEQSIEKLPATKVDSFLKSIFGLNPKCQMTLLLKRIHKDFKVTKIPKTLRI